MNGLFDLLSSFPVLEILLNPAFPACAQRCGAGSHMGDGLGDDLIAQLCRGMVCVVIHCPVCTDAKPLSRSNGVDVGTQEEKLPAHLLLPLYQRAELFIGKLPAGVLHAVRCDDKQDLVRLLLGRDRFQFVFYFNDALAYGIQQGGAAPHIVFPIRHGSDILKTDPVVEQLVGVVKIKSSSH